MFFRWFIVACSGFLGVINFACAESPDDLKKIESALTTLAPGVTPDAIAPSVIPGLYEVILGTEIVYITQDARYLIQGDVLDVATRANITEPRRDTIRAKAIDGIGEENMVVFAPKKVDHTITVFTDIDCGYCRKLHNEMASYQAEGIKVRYLFFPRTGLNTPSFDKAVAVWCSDDRNQALTDAKNGKTIPMGKCDNPVSAHYNMGGVVGVHGTPSIILEDGRMIPGYMPAARLVQVMNGKLAAVR